MDKLDIRSLQYDELINWCEQIGEKKFRAAQIYDWLHVKMVDSFDEGKIRINFDGVIKVFIADVLINSGMLE